jgi:hypothetical protein
LKSVKRTAITSSRESDMPRVPTIAVTTANQDQPNPAAMAVVHNPESETLEAEKSDVESLIDSEDLDNDNDDDNVDEESNDSWGIHIHVLEVAALDAFGGDLDLAAFFLSNLNEILGLHNSRDISKQKVNSWIPGIKSSTNSSNASGQTQSSYESQSTGDSGGQNRKRQRSLGRKQPDGKGDRGEDDEDQQERDPKKMKENEPRDKPDICLLLACPFWKQDKAKYNKNYHSANGRRGKYRGCEGPGFTDIQRLKYVGSFFTKECSS